MYNFFNWWTIKACILGNCRFMTNSSFEAKSDSIKRHPNYSFVLYSFERELPFICMFNYNYKYPSRQKSVGRRRDNCTVECSCNVSLEVPLGTQQFLTESVLEVLSILPREDIQVRQEYWRSYPSYLERIYRLGRNTGGLIHPTQRQYLG